jgi:hypothetical protein
MKSPRHNVAKSITIWQKLNPSRPTDVAGLARVRVFAPSIPLKIWKLAMSPNKTMNRIQVPIVLLLSIWFSATAGAQRLMADEHPVPSSPAWLTYSGGDGPGAGKHIVLIAADQEYRSEQSMPMLAKILATHHGFACTVLFGVNDKGQVDPTMPVYPNKGEESNFKEHNIPGLEYLEKADLVIFFTRLLTLPREQQELIVRYLDSGKPILGLRTANHGFRHELPYKIAGKQVQFGNHILGGSFMSHHGNWHQDSTRGDLVAEMKEHPILTGVKDIWGPSDVYRTFKEGGNLPEGCTALVLGQPLLGRKRGGQDNPVKEALPVAWFKNWQTSDGKTARVFHSTMGSGKDFESAGLRRLVVNASYWCLGLESEISAINSVAYVGQYEPLASGFDYVKLGVIPQMPHAYDTNDTPAENSCSEVPVKCQ